MLHFRSFVSLEVANNAKLTLGNRVFFNDHCTIRCGKEIEIGKDTMFGDGVRIFDHNHKILKLPYRKNSIYC